MTLVNVAVLLGVPEARGAHVEAAGLLVQDHSDALYLEVLASVVLSLADDLLSDLI